MTSTRKQKSRQRQENWQRHMTAWQQSGTTQAAYCEQHGLNLKTFAYWRHRLKTGDAPVRLVQIATAGPNRSEQSVVRIVIDEHTAIEVPDGFSAATLAGVLEVVRGR